VGVELLGAADCLRIAMDNKAEEGLLGGRRMDVPRRKRIFLRRVSEEEELSDVSASSCFSVSRFFSRPIRGRCLCPSLLMWRKAGVLLVHNKGSLKKIPKS